MNTPAHIDSARLIIFSRFPQPGTTKTRLISALGGEGAADLQRRMTEHIVGMARKIKSPSIKLEIRYAGGSAGDIKGWLGSDILVTPQAEGDLGKRLHIALAEAFTQGDCPLIAIGADCPAITSEIISAAIFSLVDNDLVLGPTEDGGYYLLGLNAPQAHLFSDISWGNEQVLAQTTARAADKNMAVKLLPTLADIDRPEDLVHLPANFSR